ncbi:MAG: cold shock domain-containing protein [bacterium]
MKGKVKRLIRDRGFGFIEAEDGKDIFFHQTCLTNTSFESLSEGSSVEFDVERSPKGLRATNVKVS